MKLKTRLKIAFLTMVIGPVLVITIAMIGFSHMKIASLEKSYGIDFSLNYLLNSAQTISESTHEVWEEMEQTASDNPDRFLNFAYLQGLDDELSGKLSYLLVLKDGEVYFVGNDTAADSSDDQDKKVEELVRHLPDYGSADDSGMAVYIGGSSRAMVKQVDIAFTDGSKGSAFIVTSGSAMIPDLRAIVIQAVVLAVLVLALIAFCMMYWIYRSVNKPISQLREATNRIAKGDLDFTLETTGKDEIADLTRDFESMRRRLKESEDEKKKYDQENKELISNISHDLKTPITTVKGYCEGIIDGVADTPEKMDRYIKTIYNKANDMDRLINELTFYTKIDANRIPYNFIRLNVTEYFDDCAEELGMDLEERGIRFVYENRVDPSTMIIADPEQLKRVINNIVGNSVKYIDQPHGTIQLRVLDAGDFIQVDLEDNGKGIEPKELARIFDRFYRTDQARSTSTGGSGIGLSIVKKIIEDHSGRIWASSRPGRGTTMSFVIRKYQENIQ